MPDADSFEWPQGKPLFEVMWRAVTESLAGNGVVNNGDLEITATTNDMEIQIASGTAFYVATEYTLSSSKAITLSNGDSTHDRWDTVYFDTSVSDAGVREGTPASNPEPPDIQGSELLLGFVYVPASATDVSSSNILNWRATFSNEAEEVHYDDSTGTYSVSNVDAALDELQEAAKINSHPLSLSSDTDMDVNGTDLTDSTLTGTVLYESTNGWFRNEKIQALANFTSDEQFDSYPLTIGTDVSSHLDGNDLLDSSGGTTVFDQTTGNVPRPQVDDERTNTTVTSSTYTTSDEEVVLVDTATIGGSSTITLASADVSAGNVIGILDLTGSAGTNNITVDTGSSETIDGNSSHTIDQDYGGGVFICDGTNWITISTVFQGVTVEDSASLVLSAAEGMDFGTALNATDNGDGTVTIDANLAGKTNLATGSFTHTGGSSTLHTVSAVTTDQTKNLHLELGVNSDPSFNADYAFDYEKYYQWDDANQELDIQIDVTWITDPGSGNDIDLDYEIYEIDDQATQGVGTEDSGTGVVSPARSINFGSGLDVADDGDETVTVDSTTSNTTATKIQPVDGHDVNSTGTLDFDNVVFDEISGVSVDTTNNEINITSTGTYEIGFGIEFNTSENNNRQSPGIWIENGGTKIPGSHASHTYIRENGGHTRSSANVNIPVQLTDGDTLTIAHASQTDWSSTCSVTKANSAVYIKRLA